MKTWHLIMIAILVGAYVTNYGGFATWVGNIGKPGTTLPTTPLPVGGGVSGTQAGITGTVPAAGTLGAPYEVRGRLIYTNGSPVTYGQSVTVYTPGTGDTLQSQGSDTADSSGWFQGPQVKEGQIWYLNAEYNSTGKVQTQWYGPFKMAWARDMFPSGWTNTYLLVPESPFIMRTAPIAAADIDITMFHSDGSAVGTTTTPSWVSKSSTTYVSADETFTISLFVKKAWTATGGKFTQPKTNQGNDQTTLTSVARVSFNATSGVVWASSGWSGISGQSTTTNKTIEIPIVETFSTQPVRYDVTLKLNFNSATTNNRYHIKVDWIDTQDFNTVKEGSETTRVAPNPGYIYLKSETFAVKVGA